MAGVLKKLNLFMSTCSRALWSPLCSAFTRRNSSGIFFPELMALNSHANSENKMIGNDEIFFFKEVTSTMDKAKKLLKQGDNSISSKKIFTVVADSQTAGRGTRGRNWMSNVGNMYMTAVIDMSDVPVEITVVPIRVGTFILRAIDKIFASDHFNPTEMSPLVQLKWPNDIIVSGKKVSGVLIEVESGKMLIGIGCNISSSPTIPNTGSDSGSRDATHLVHELGLKSAGKSLDSAEKLRNYIVRDIHNSLSCWIHSNHDNVSDVVSEFQKRMDKSPQTLRRDNYLDQELSCGDEIIPIALNLDGTLQVFHRRSNSERTLNAEYLR